VIAHNCSAPRSYALELSAQSRAELLRETMSPRDFLYRIAEATFRDNAAYTPRDISYADPNVREKSTAAHPLSCGKSAAVG
jgi:hypothetical protein